MATTTQALETVGTKEVEIPVSISYRIIELFSAGLYSSPNKAIEELVSNSYDALATHVQVIVPANMEAPNAVIWVIDDGTGMDAVGLFDLWQIASSKKRIPGTESAERPPIGKFGIGKLATYVLARQLTYLSKAKGEYRAVTMDFSRVDQDRKNTESHLTLDVRKLTEAEAQLLLAPIINRKDAAASGMPLFGKKARESWTVVAMGNLTALAQKLSFGRLRWVLATALPLSPQFNLYFNGERLESSRTKLQPLKAWRIGESDEVANELKLPLNAKPVGVLVDGVGLVTGESQIFEDSLTGGKAELMGRSHGIFVLVRGRLINLDDALFGLPQMSHGPFVRFRMVLTADGLDEVLRSTRETVLESEGVSHLRRYISDKFNEARAWYNRYLAEKEYTSKLSTRVGSTSLSLSRRPLLSAVRGVLDGAFPPLFLTRVPQNLTAAQKKSLIERLESDLISETGIIKDVRFEALSLEDGLAVYDAQEGCVRVNLLHPFYANYSDHYANAEPFELLAVAEVLTEAYLLEEDLAPDSVNTVMRRRDKFLRELVWSRQLSAPLVAELLQDSTSNPAGLEQAVAAGLQSLGFEVSPLGGTGRPDGLALARVGVRDEASGTRGDYRITYDAKSSGKDRVQAHTVGAAGIARHRRDYNADYSLVVAPGFAGDGSETDAVIKEARAEAITLLTIADFVKLVYVAATRQLGFTKLRDLFANCRTPTEAASWIQKIALEQSPEGPIPEILNAVWELQASSNDPVKFAAVKMQSETLKKYREKEVREMLESVRRLTGGYVSIDGDIVSLEVPPEKILSEIRRISHKVPIYLREKSIFKALSPGIDAEEQQNG